MRVEGSWYIREELKGRELCNLFLSDVKYANRYWSRIICMEFKVKGEYGLVQYWVALYVFSSTSMRENQLYVLSELEKCNDLSFSRRARGNPLTGMSMIFNF